MQRIFIHGLGQSPKAWDRTIFMLKQDMPVACPDLQGLLFNKTHTYENLYHAFCEYCEEFPEPLSLCGLSLGAILALHYTIDHPSRVQELVLICAQYKMPRLLLKLQVVIYKMMKEATFLQEGFDKRDYIELTDSMRLLDFSESLKNVSCKTLVLCGEKDNANKKAARELAAHLSVAELQMVAGAGHEVNVDAPETLAGILDKYYEKLTV